MDVTVPGLGGIEMHVGGYPRLVTGLAELKAAAEAEGHAVLKLHAGDAITGTTYYSLFHGEADAALMHHACFDAFALGNHEFDDGDANLAAFLTMLHNSSMCSRTQVLAANVVPGPSSPLQNGMLNKSAVFTINGHEVGVVGIDIAQKTMASSSPSEGTTLTDEKEAAQAEIDILIAEGVNKIVLLTHIGYDNDMSWMSTLTGVDVVIGGDSHSLLGDSNYSQIGNVQGAYPTTMMNGDGKVMCIAQAWEYTKVLGDLKVEFDADGDVVSCGGKPRLLFEADVFSYASDGSSVTGDDLTLVNTYLMTDDMFHATAADSMAASTLAGYSSQVDVLKQTVIAQVPSPICRERIPGQGHGGCTTAESVPHGGPACQLVSKAFLERTPTAHISIQNGGGCRNGIPPGLVGTDFSIDDAYTVLPFSNTLVTMTMTGAQIKTLLEAAVSYLLSPGGSSGAYPYASGLRWSVNMNGTDGNRFSNLEVNPRFEGSWTPISDTDMYVVVTNDFISAGRDGYTTFTETSVADSLVDTYVEYAQGLIDYAEEVGTLVAPPVSEHSTQSFIDAVGACFGKSCPMSLTILHINDAHSNLLDSSMDVTVPGLGGIEMHVGGYPRLVTGLAELKAAAEAEGHAVLKLHAGDAITGTTYYSLFHGEADAALMHHACFDAFALGNHEFDDGDANLAAFLTMLHNSSMCSRTQVLAANVVPGPSSPLQNGMLNKSAVFTINGHEVGVVGIDIAQKTMASSSPSEGTTLTDEKEAAQAEIDILIAEGVNKIVLLTHIGYDNDMSWMSTLTGVDVVIGGDSHSLLGDSNYSQIGNVQGAYPTTMMNGDGKVMCIAQAWEYTKVLGDLKVEFDADGDVVSCGGKPRLLFEADVFSYASDGSSVTGDDLTLVNTYLMTDDMFHATAADSMAASTLAGYSSQVDVLKQTVIAQVPSPICRERIPGQGHGGCTTAESVPHGGPACQLVSKAFLERTPTAHISIQNGGGCRNGIPPGLVGTDFSIDDAYTVLPFSNTLVTMTMTGAQIKTLLEAAVSYLLSPGGSSGAYPYASGLRWSVNMNGTDGNRFSNLEVNPRFEGSWTPISDTDMYVVVTNDFISAGRDGYTTFTETSVADSLVDTYVEYAQGLIDYAEEVGTLVAPPVSEHSTQSFIDADGVEYRSNTTTTVEVSTTSSEVSCSVCLLPYRSLLVGFLFMSCFAVH